MSPYLFLYTGMFYSTYSSSKYWDVSQKASKELVFHFLTQYFT